MQCKRKLYTKNNCKTKNETKKHNQIDEYSKTTLSNAKILHHGQYDTPSVRVCNVLDKLIKMAKSLEWKCTRLHRKNHKCQMIDLYPFKIALINSHGLQLIRLTRSIWILIYLLCIYILIGSSSLLIQPFAVSVIRRWDYSLLSVTTGQTIRFVCFMYWLNALNRRPDSHAAASNHTHSLTHAHKQTQMRKLIFQIWLKKKIFREIFH